MSIAASIILDALARAERDHRSGTTVMIGLLATRRLRNALAPRISAARPLTESMFNIVAAAPTAWCAADLRLVSPTVCRSSADTRRVRATPIDQRRRASPRRSTWPRWPQCRRR